MRPSATEPIVAELQGLYGAFSFPEKLLQKIWLRGDFDHATAVVNDGRALRIRHPGKWNLLGGPDFTGARLRLGPATASEVNGDVELHLRAGDWDAHGHAADPAYDRVILHVVLFPPEGGHVTRGGNGREIPVLTLLPLLHRSLEEFATDEAVETLANRAISRLPDELGALPVTELAALLERHAAARWRQKVHYARQRLERLGWTEACHHAALEILGFRFNRAPMLRLAGEFPLAVWTQRQVEPDTLFEHEREGWSLQGVRPANHPRARLRQYAAWVQERSDWPARARALAERLPAIEATTQTREVRRRHRFSALRGDFADVMGAGAVGGSRLDNLVCDGLLPLLSAESGRGFFDLWYYWQTGDLPAALTGGLRQLGIFDGRGQPACHGAAQGLLGWLLEREARR